MHHMESHGIPGQRFSGNLVIEGVGAYCLARCPGERMINDHIMNRTLNNEHGTMTIEHSTWSAAYATLNIQHRPLRIEH